MKLFIFFAYVYAEFLATHYFYSNFGFLKLALILFLGLPIGSWMLRFGMRNFVAVKQNDMPRGLARGALWLTAGLLFMVPGLVCKALAGLLLLPFADRLIGASVARRVSAWRSGPGMQFYWTSSSRQGDFHIRPQTERDVTPLVIDVKATRQDKTSE